MNNRNACAQYALKIPLPRPVPMVVGFLCWMVSLVRKTCSLDVHSGSHSNRFSELRMLKRSLCGLPRPTPLSILCLHYSDDHFVKKVVRSKLGWYMATMGGDQCQKLVTHLYNYRAFYLYVEVHHSNESVIIICT